MRRLSQININVNVIVNVDDNTSLCLNRLMAYASAINFLAKSNCSLLAIQYHGHDANKHCREAHTTCCTEHIVTWTVLVVLKETLWLLFWCCCCKSVTIQILWRWLPVSVCVRYAPAHLLLVQPHASSANLHSINTNYPPVMILGLIINFSLFFYHILHTSVAVSLRAPVLLVSYSVVTARAAAWRSTVPHAVIERPADTWLVRTSDACTGRLDRRQRRRENFDENWSTEQTATQSTRGTVTWVAAVTKQHNEETKTISTLTSSVTNTERFDILY